MLIVNGKRFKTSSEVGEHFGVRASTVRNWVQDAKKRKIKVIKKINLVLEVE